MDYRYGSHTIYKIQYHFVFVTKYRYQVLKGDVGPAVPDQYLKAIGYKGFRKRSRSAIRKLFL